MGSAGAARVSVGSGGSDSSSLVTLYFHDSAEELSAATKRVTGLQEAQGMSGKGYHLFQALIRFTHWLEMKRTTRFFNLIIPSQNKVILF